MSNLKTKQFILILLLSSIVWSSCRTSTEVINIERTSTRAAYYKNESDAFCVGNLDRTGLRSWVRDFDPSSSVLAGFTTLWVPGSDPFPCNRLHRFIGQGVFSFDLSDIAGRITFASYESARIVINNYTASNGNTAIIVGATWGINGQIYSQGSIIPSDQYELKLVTQNWESGEDDWASTAVNSANLGNNDLNNTFSVPFIAGDPNIYERAGTNVAAINVSNIVRRILASGGRYGDGTFGFAIEPVGRGLNYCQNNSSTGHFTVTLEVTYKID